MSRMLNHDTPADDTAAPSVAPAHANTSPPSPYAITPVPADVPRTTTMQGFDEFRDIVDYIEKTTYSIWDEKNIGLIYRYYTPTTVVWTSDGRTFGRDKVIENSSIKMAAFPDIRDFIEDTIWAGNDQEGYRTSMRWTWTATNTGYSIYGPPTGRRVVNSGIANCIVRGEHIIEEWVVYNELSLIRQLGLDPWAAARAQVEHEPAPLYKPGAGEVERLHGQQPPATMPPSTRDGFDLEDFVRRCYHEVWNWRMFGKVDDYYAPNHIAHAASDREIAGLGDLKQDILARVAAFPDLRVHIDDLYWNEDGPGRYRVAVLWSMLGTHTGPSVWGKPTGKRVRMMGISHHRMVNNRFVEEWTEWNEFNLMKQLVRP